MKRSRIVAFCVLFVIGALILAFDVKVASGLSMSPTIKDSEVLLIFKLAYGLKLPFAKKYLLTWNAPKKQDAVIFRIDGRNVVKRVALASGEKINCKEINSNKYLLLDEKLIKLSGEEFRNICGNSFETWVPEKTFLALGDNLSLSEDSRHYGFVPEESVLGKVLCK
ncbi:MAG: signal peptidase I [Treponemataceae bacterium]